MLHIDVNTWGIEGPKSVELPMMQYQVTRMGNHVYLTQPDKKFFNYFINAVKRSEEVVWLCETVSAAKQLEQGLLAHDQRQVVFHRNPPWHQLRFVTE